MRVPIRHGMILLSVGMVLWWIVTVHTIFSLNYHEETKSSPALPTVVSSSSSSYCDNNNNNNNNNRSNSPGTKLAGAEEDHPVIQPKEEEQEQVFEFPFRLSCPGQVLKKRNNNNNTPYHIVVGYHIGGMRNYKMVVRDQLRTLHECGLGHAMDYWYVSYSGGSNNNKSNNSNLKQNNQNHKNDVMSLLMGRDQPPYVNYSWSVPPQVMISTGIPWEGTMFNRLRKHCQTTTATTIPTIVFYWHTKGTSRWKSDWRDHMDQPYTYSRVLYWRKYMEYFIHERPSYCIHRVLYQGALTCGVDRKPARGIYGGNFWAASCEYLEQLPQLKIHPPASSDNNNNKKHSEGYFDAEEVFGSLQTKDNDFNNTTKYVSLHQPTSKLKGFYYRLIEPSEYASTIANWGPDV